jgi:hypothetical protein
MHILTPYFLTVFLLFSSGTIVALNESEKKLTRAQFIVELEALHPGVIAVMQSEQFIRAVTSEPTMQHLFKGLKNHDLVAMDELIASYTARESKSLDTIDRSVGNEKSASNIPLVEPNTRGAIQYRENGKEDYNSSANWVFGVFSIIVIGWMLQGHSWDRKIIDTPDSQADK